MTDPESPEHIDIIKDLTACPHCGVNLLGDPIEPSRREFFGGRTHGSRLIGVEVGDRLHHYECPGCGEHFPPDPPTPGAFRSSNVEVRRR